VSGAAQVVDVHLHHAFDDVLDHLPQQIGVRPFSTRSVSAMLGLVIVVFSGPWLGLVTEP
jgi:hypothetical protein